MSQRLNIAPPLEKREDTINPNKVDLTPGNLVWTTAHVPLNRVRVPELVMVVGSTINSPTLIKVLLDEQVVEIHVCSLFPTEEMCARHAYFYSQNPCNEIALSNIDLGCILTND